MWIFTTGGFLSAVEHRGDPRLLVVRSRARRDLRPFRCRVISTPDADYQFRVVVTRADLARFLEREVRRISYYNFKDACPKGRHPMMLRVWTVVADAFQTWRGHAQERMPGLRSHLRDETQAADPLHLRLRDAATQYPYVPVDRGEVRGRLAHVHDDAGV